MLLPLLALAGLFFVVAVARGKLVLAPENKKLAELGRKIQAIASSPTVKQFFVLAVSDPDPRKIEGDVFVTLLGSFDDTSQAVEFLKGHKSDDPDSWLVFDKTKIRTS